MPDIKNIDDLKAFVETKAAEIVQNTVGTAVKDRMDAFLASDQFKAMITPPKKDDIELAKQDAVGFKTLGEQLCAIRNLRVRGIVDPRLQYLDSNGKRVLMHEDIKGMSEAVDSAGGFLVQPEFRKEILEVALEGALVRPNGAVAFPSASDTVSMPALADYTHASNVFGGLHMYWTPEAGTPTESQPSWGRINLTAHKLMGYTPIPNELLADAGVPLEPLMRRMMGQATGFFEDDAFINGTGAGQPLGILQAPCAVTVTRKAIGKVYFSDFVNMWAQLLPTSRGRAIWLLNHEVFPYLMSTQSYDGALAAGSNLVWINPNAGGLANAVPGTILGRPFFLTEKLQSVGTSGDIALVDLSYYLIMDRQAITIDVSTHVGFTSDQTYFRVVTRMDGQPWLKSAITPRKGSKTLSPIVILTTSS